MPRFHAAAFAVAALCVSPAWSADDAGRAAAKARPAPLKLYAPSAFPGALPEGRASTVKFTVLLAGGAARPAPEVTLQVRGLGRSVAMRDDGRGADLSAGDRVYSAAVRFDADQARAGRCYDAQASARASKGPTLRSAVRRVCVTRFAVGMAASDHSASNIIAFTEGGVSGRVLADQVLVTVRPGLGDDRIAALAQLVDGTVVGAVPDQNLYQIRLRKPQTTDGLRQALAKLQGADGVVQAAPNALLQSYGPIIPPTHNDPSAGLQANLDRVNAKQAWAITTGDPGLITAIIDSGADFDQPDFWDSAAGTDTRFRTSGGNIFAADCVAAACTTLASPPPVTCHATNTCNLLADGITPNPATDTFGHGTVVAGIAGAYTNNNVSIAGTTWQGKLLIVRDTADGSIDAGKLLDGINYARGQGAMILSISQGAAFTFVRNQLCPAVDAADVSEGRLVVAAAGNDGVTTMNYPAACECGVNFSAPSTVPCPDAMLAGTRTSLAVANSEVSGGVDVIHTGTLPSNYGSWVQVAAPGTNVISTARTGTCGTCNAAYAGTGTVTVTGTSFSTPLVAGAAGLVMARSPSSGAQVRALLQSTGVVLHGAGSVTDAQVANIKRIDVLAALLTFNTAPTATNLSAPETYTEDTPLSLTDIVVSDADGPLATATLTLSNPAAGSLSTATSGLVTSTYVAATGVWTASGPVADVNVLLAGVVFSPAPDFNGNFTIATSVTDEVAAPITGSKAMTGTPANDPPTGLPTISGIPTEDQTLTAVTAAIADIDGLGPFSYQWLRGGVDIPGATGSTYVLDDPDVGQPISVRVRYTDGGGTLETLTSAVTAPIANVNDPPTGLPTISGTLTVGQTLTAVTAAIADADGLGSFSYQWLRGVTPIAGATGSTYVLVAADFGTVANVRVSYTDGHGTVETLTTVNATNTGDPHLTTVDGLHYDFQAAGEFVTLRGANGMEIQTRQTPVSTAGALTDPYSGLSVGVSINTAVAARVGTHRVTLQPAAGGFELRVDGAPTTLPAGGIDLGQGARVVPVTAGATQVDFPDGTTMVVTPGFWTSHNVWYLNVSVFHTSARDGIMGARNGGSWLPRLADGTSFGAMPAALQDRYVELYEKFASSWRVTKQTSLFDYVQGTSTETFTAASWPPQNPPFVAPQGGEVARPIGRKIAEQQCRAVADRNRHADCVFDVMATGNHGFARTYRLEQKVQDGLTAIVLHDDRKTAKPRQPVTFTATVVRSAVLPGVVQRSADARSKPGRPVVPAGTVQFTLDGRNFGQPVPLDAKGQARVKIPQAQLGTRQLAARYRPAEGSVFLASRSLEKPRKDARLTPSSRR